MLDKLQQQQQPITRMAGLKHVGGSPPKRLTFGW